MTLDRSWHLRWLKLEGSELNTAKSYGGFGRSVLSGVISCTYMLGLSDNKMLSHHDAARPFPTTAISTVVPRFDLHFISL